MSDLTSDQFRAKYPLTYAAVDAGFFDSPSKAREFSRQMESALAAAQAELAALKRGEFICRKCGLRKDGEWPSADF